MNGKTYDGNTTATVLTDGTLGGVVSGDSLTLTLGGTTFADKNAGDNKTVSGTYTVTGGDAANYQFAGGGTTTAFTANANIARASLTIVNAGTVQDKIYDGTTNATLTGSTFSGNVTGDDVNVSLTGGFAQQERRLRHRRQRQLLAGRRRLCQLHAVGRRNVHRYGEHHAEDPHRRHGGRGGRQELRRHHLGGGQR